MDMTTAFLYGDLGEDIYIYPPKGFPEEGGKILKLKKTLYGLKQSLRTWYQKFRSEIKKFNFVILSYNLCLFIYR